MIRAEGLVKRQGGRAVVDDLSFAVPEGEVFGLAGVNGSGKTTTIRILATLLAADQGDASIGGVSVRKHPRAVRSLIGYVPDTFGVHPRVTALEHLELSGRFYGLARARRRGVADGLLELVGLAERAADDVDGLSRGQKQRLGLARALVHDPAVLLLDGPTCGLDPSSKVEVCQLVKELQGAGKTVLVSSHDLSELEAMCSWVGLIADGKMVAAGPIDEMRDQAGGAGHVVIGLTGGDPAQSELASRLVESLPGVEMVEVAGHQMEVALDDAGIVHQLLAHLVGNGVQVQSFSAARAGLAEVFRRLQSEGSTCRS